MKITRAELKELVKEVISEAMTRDDIKRLRQRYDPDETPGATEMGGRHALAGRPPLEAPPEGVSSNIADMWMSTYLHAYDSIKKKEMGEARADADPQYQMDQADAMEGEDDYEAAFELELRRANRDGLRGKEAYERAKKNLQSLGITPGKSKPALGEQVVEAEGGKMSQLKSAIEAFKSDTNFVGGAAALTTAVQKQLRIRPKQMHPAIAKLVDLGGPWSTGPEMDGAVRTLSYEMMGEKEPQRPTPEDTQETPAQQRSREASVAAIDRKMGRKYR